MDIFAQLLINGIIAGAIYALVASGFSLIYSTNKFVHFAHGGVVLLSAYFLFWMFSVWEVGFCFSVFLTLLFSSFLGYVLNRFFYHPFRKRRASGSILLVAGASLLIIMESLVVLFFGTDVRTINFFDDYQIIKTFGAVVTPLQLLIVVVSAILFSTLYFMMKKTKLGKAMRATADNKTAAEIVGVSSEKIYKWSFAIGSTIAGVGAVLISLEQNITPSMGNNLMIKGFTGAIIGGVGSVPGAILGSLFLGLVENFGIWFLPSSYKDALAFMLLFVFLLFRPWGLLGIKYKKND